MKHNIGKLVVRTTRELFCPLADSLDGRILTHQLLCVSISSSLTFFTQTKTDALLMNMDSWHRGSAHVDPNGLDRVMMVTTWVPRPQRRAESRQMAQGITYSLRWDHWGFTWNDFQKQQEVGDHAHESTIGRSPSSSSTPAFAYPPVQRSPSSQAQ